MVKYLVMNEQLKEFGYIDFIRFSKKEETLYVEAQSHDNGTTYDTIEMATSREQMINIRDFLNECLKTMEAN